MALKRDERLVADQIIQHELVGKTEAQLLGLLVIELRRLRVQIDELINRQPKDAGP